MQQSDAHLQDDIRYALIAVDMAGAKVKEEIGTRPNVVLRPLDPNLPPPETVTYQIGYILNLAPGRYQLRASAMSSKVGEGGSVYLPIDVPDFSQPALAVSALVLGYAGGQRVPCLRASRLAAVARARRGVDRRRAVPPRAAAPLFPGGCRFRRRSIGSSWSRMTSRCTSRVVPEGSGEAG